MVLLKNVIKNYNLGKTTVKALKGISLEIPQGSFTAISGVSGAGKTTLLNLIGTLDKPTSGEIIVCDKNTEGLSEKESSKLRLEKIGFIFQDFNLISVLNAYENIEFPSLFVKNKKNKDEILDMIETLGLTDYIKHRPDELSGGQRQRVAITRALVNNPRIILADEPTANLDHKTAEVVIDFLRKINRKYNTTVIFSTHDKSILNAVDNVVLLQDGRIQ